MDAENNDKSTETWAPAQSVTRDSNHDTGPRDRRPLVLGGAWGCLLTAGMLLSLGLNVVTIAALSDARETVRDEARRAANSLEDAAGAPLAVRVPVSETLPISLGIPIDTVVEAEIDEEIAVRGAQVEIPIAGRRIPLAVDITVPVRTTIVVPVQQTVEISTTVPVSLSLPVQVEIAGTPLGDMLEEIEAALRRLSRRF